MRIDGKSSDTRNSRVLGFEALAEQELR
jgi:hypothetical protein